MRRFRQRRQSKGLLAWHAGKPGESDQRADTYIEHTSHIYLSHSSFRISDPLTKQLWSLQQTASTMSHSTPVTLTTIITSNWCLYNTCQSTLHTGLENCYSSRRSEVRGQRSEVKPHLDSNKVETTLRGEGSGNHRLAATRRTEQQHTFRRSYSEPRECLFGDKIIFSNYRPLLYHEPYIMEAIGTLIKLPVFSQTAHDMAANLWVLQRPLNCLL